MVVSLRSATLLVQRKVECSSKGWLYSISDCSSECDAFVRSAIQRELENAQLETWQTFQVVNRAWWQHFTCWICCLWVERKCYWALLSVNEYIINVEFGISKRLCQAKWLDALLLPNRGRVPGLGWNYLAIWWQARKSVSCGLPRRNSLGSSRISPACVGDLFNCWGLFLSDDRSVKHLFFTIFLTS